MIIPVPCSSATVRQRRYRSSEHAGVQSGAVTIRKRSSRPCHRSCRRSNDCHHVVDRPRVAHRRPAHLLGQIGGQAFQEPLVGLVDVDVLVAAHEPERRPHPDVLVRPERGRTSEIGHPGTAVVHVHRRRLATLQRVDQPPEHAGVEVLLLHVAGCRLDEDVGPLEDELVQAGADRELGVVVAVHEARHHEVSGRAEDALERTARLQLGARPGGHDRRAFDDQRPVRDQRLLPERDDRIAEDQRAGPRCRKGHDRRRLTRGRPSGRARDGTRRSPPRAPCLRRWS